MIVKQEWRVSRRVLALLARLWRVGTCLGLAGLCLLLGYRLGSRRAWLRDQRAAAGPEVAATAPARWVGPSVPGADARPAVPASAPSPSAATVLDASKPVRVTWPLDIGPDESSGRLCLRARQGANELQDPGQGRAVYGFRLESSGIYKTWFRVRWATVAPGSIMCDNSWFAGFDDRPLEVIGNETAETDWFWQPGPSVELSAGLHWLRVELREDGPLLERIALVPATAALAPGDVEQQSPISFSGLAGERFPHDPEYAVLATEFYALPTRSLVIGAGHENEITVGASYQERSGPGFRGRIEIRCPTAPGLVVSGEPDLECSPATPFVRRLLTLRFPDDLPRRVHHAEVVIRDEGGAALFRSDIRFLKGYAWAFLGPFRDTSDGSQDVYRYTGASRRVQQPCDGDPAKLAALSDPAALGLSELPLTSAGAAAWRVVSDGSCYDWTGAVDLQRVYGPTTLAYAYAVTWINAETLLNHRSFTFQADDSGWLWVNGHTAVELPIDLPREANRLWTSVPLQKGLNPVVVKLTQNQMYWGFRFDVIDWHWQGRRGDVVTGVEAEAWPK
jgi:hypothetical protein